MLKCIVTLSVSIVLVTAEDPIDVYREHGIKPSNVLGGSEQHASFSFVRPGLTQTAFAFNGPSSHQAFSSSIGNSHLAHKVLPNVAQALAYRNPGLGYNPLGPIQTVYTPRPIQTPYQLPTDQLTALSHLHQQQQQFMQYQQSYQAPAYYPQYQYQSDQTQASDVNAAYQSQIQRLLSARLQQRPGYSHVEQVQQVQQPQNLIGVAYSSSPSVAHVKLSGNGYKLQY